MEELKHILKLESTRWAELLLGSIKVMLGISLLWYLWEPPPRTGHGVSVPVAVGLGMLLLFIGVIQLWGVLASRAIMRQMAVVLATGVWISFMGAVLLSSGTVRPVLVYVPLVVFNVVVATRLGRSRG